MKFKFLLALSIILFQFTSQAKSVPGYILFFQPLYSFQNKGAQAYLDEIKMILAQSKHLEVQKLITSYGESGICTKKKRRSCLEAIYGKNLCIKKNEQPTKICHKRSQRKASLYFTESVFHRLTWNRFALGLSSLCQKKDFPICKSLHKVHKRYMKAYYKQLHQKKKNKTQKEW